MAQKRVHEESLPSRPRKQARTYTEADLKLARTYEDLASELRDVQIEAAIELVQYYSANGAPEKVLTRLIRGLCSSRKAARLGFFSALVEILKSVPRDTESFKVVLKKIEALTQPEGGASKQEKKEHQVGRLAGLSAVVHSRLLFSEPFDVENLSQLFLSSSAIAERSPHLTEQCGRLWVDIVEVAAEGAYQVAINELLELVRDNRWSLTPEGIAVWLRVRALAPRSSFPPKVWHRNDPLCKQEAEKLLNAMRSDKRYHVLDNDGDLRGKEGATEQTAAHPTFGVARREPHFVVEMIIHDLIGREDESTGDSKKGKPAKVTKESDFQRVWFSVIDDLYFISSSSAERKALGFRTFELALPEIPDSFFPHALSPRMMECFLNELRFTEGPLHEAAKSVLERLRDKVQSGDHPTILRDIARFSPTNRPSPYDLKHWERLQFIMEDLLQCTSPESAENILPIFETGIRSCFSVLEQGFASEPYSCARILTNLLVTLVKALGQENTEFSYSMRQRGVQLLAEAACAPRLPQFTSEANALIHSRLWACLKDVLEGSEEVMQHVLLESAISFEPKETAGLKDAPEFILEAAELSKFSLETLELHFPSHIESPSDTDEISRITTGYIVLLSITLLRVYSDAARGQDLVNLLSDIQESFNQYFSSVFRYRLIAFRGTTDMILAYSSESEGVFRLTAERAFACFAPEFKHDDFNPLFYVLEQEENLSGQRQLFRQELGSGDEDDDDEEKMSDGLIGEDAEEEDSEGGDLEGEDSEGEDSEGEDSEDEVDADDASKDSSEEPSSSESEDQQEDGAGETDDANEALNNSLGQILGTMALDGGADDDEVASDSDADMTDTEMERLNVDEQLSNIFRQRKAVSSIPKPGESHKTQQKEAKRLVLMFKTRVLNLLGIYINACHDSWACLGVLLPLCRLIGATKSAPLARKAGELLERYVKLCKKRPSRLPVDTENHIMWSTLVGVHVEALLFRSKTHATACSRASLFLARVLVAKARVGHGEKEELEREVVQKLKGKYEDTKRRKTELQSQLPEVFWENWAGWLDSMGLR